MDTDTQRRWLGVSVRNARAIPAFEECTSVVLQTVLQVVSVWCLLTLGFRFRLGQEAQGHAVSPQCFKLGGWVPVWPNTYAGNRDLLVYGSMMSPQIHVY